MAENISKIILNGTEYALKDNVTQYHTINGQAITGGTGDIVITGGSGLKKWEGTRAEYNALSSYDADTLYIITDEDVVIPTKTSELTNDSNFITGVDLSNYATTATTTQLQTNIDKKQDKLTNTEEITFTLEDGSTVTKTFYIQ